MTIIKEIVKCGVTKLGLLYALLQIYLLIKLRNNIKPHEYKQIHLKSN